MIWMQRKSKSIQRSSCLPSEPITTSRGIVWSRDRCSSSPCECKCASCGFSYIFRSSLRSLKGSVFLGWPKMQDRRGLDARHGLIPCGGGHGHGGLPSPLTQDRVSYDVISWVLFPGPSLAMKDSHSHILCLPCFSVFLKAATILFGLFVSC